MSAPTFALAIPHTPWVPARVASLARLCEGLGIPYDAASAPENGIGRSRIFGEKEPNHVWSESMWTWFDEGPDTQETHALQLQDDVIVAPRFWPKLSALVSAFPESVICLESVHPGAMTLARQHIHAYSTLDQLIGVGWVVPMQLMSAFNRWRRTRLKRGAQALVTEDTLMAMWCVVEGHPIVSPCPTLIDHDITIESTYRNDAHAHRRPVVTWRDGEACAFEEADLEVDAFWRGTHGPEFLGLFYPGVPRTAVIHCNDFSVADAQKIVEGCKDVDERLRRFLR